MMLRDRPPGLVLKQLVHLSDEKVSLRLVIGTQATPHLQSGLAL